MVPVLMLFIGLIQGGKIAIAQGADGDLGAAVGGFVGLILSMVVIKIVTILTKKSDFLSPTMVAKADDYSSPFYELEQK